MFNVILATLNPTVADLITQKNIEGRKEIDFRRTATFATFGALYLGGAQWFVHVVMYRRMFPTMDRFAKASFKEKLRDKAGMVGAAKQAATDIFFHLPFMYFPVFYTVKESLQGTGGGLSWMREGFKAYRQNFWADAKVAALVWGPADCIIFAVPMWLRLPSRHVVSFGWNAYLSLTRGSPQ